MEQGVRKGGLEERRPFRSGRDGRALLLQTETRSISEQGVFVFGVVGQGKASRAPSVMMVASRAADQRKVLELEVAFATDL